MNEEDEALLASRQLVSKMYLEGKFSTASSGQELTILAHKIIDNKIQHMEMTSEKIPSNYSELKDFVIHMVRKVGNPTGVVSFNERELEGFLDSFVKSLGLDTGDDSEEDEGDEEENDDED